MKLRRLLSGLLVFCMLFTLLPVVSSAGDDAGTGGGGTEGGENDPSDDGLDNTITTWRELQAALSNGGDIILDGDITAVDRDVALKVPSGVTATLDLNGKKIDRALTSPASKGSVIIVTGELTVKDTKGGGMITGGNTNGTGGGVWVRSGGCFTLESGSISGNKASYVGGGVCVSGKNNDGVVSSFIMNGGSITGNTSRNGGGIGMDSHGSITVNGGEISGNNASVNGGGAWFAAGTTFTLNGGRITGNTAADNGGGVYVNDGGLIIHEGIFVQNGGTVSGNTPEDVGSASGYYSVKYSLDAVISGGGSGRVLFSTEAGGQGVSVAAEGVTVEVTALPEDESGYGSRFTGLTVSAGNTSIPVTEQSDGTFTFTMPASDVTVNAEFKTEHSVETSVILFNDQNYTQHGCTLNADKWHAVEGETVTMTLNLATGYSKNGESKVQYLDDEFEYHAIPINNVNDTTFTFVMPDEDAYVTAYIETAVYTVSLAEGISSSSVNFLLNNEPRDNVPFTADVGADITVMYFPDGLNPPIESATYTWKENDGTHTSKIVFEWEDYSGAQEGSFIMPNGNVTIRLQYKELHSIIEEQSANGVIAADPGAACEEDTVNVYATPDPGYALEKFIINGGEYEASPDENGIYSMQFTMPDRDVNVSAVFKKVIFRLNIDGTEHGTITTDSEYGTAGNLVEFTVIPEDHYKIDNVYVRTESGNEPPLGETMLEDGASRYSFTMPYEDVTIYAEFAVGSSWADLAAVLSADKGGTITLKQTYTADAGDSMLTVKANKAPVTLDLNGCNIVGSDLVSAYVIKTEGSVTITSNASPAVGNITGKGQSGVINIDSGSLTLSGLMNVEGTNMKSCVVRVGYNGGFCMDGADVQVNGYGSCGRAVVDVDGYFELRSGTVQGDAKRIVIADVNVEPIRLFGGVIKGLNSTASDPYSGLTLIDSRLYIEGDVSISGGTLGGLQILGESEIYLRCSPTHSYTVSSDLIQEVFLYKINADNYYLNLTEDDISHFVSAFPDDYRVVLTGGSGTRCGTFARAVTVTFDSNGGSAVVPAHAGPGEKIAEPQDPVKPGSEFLGWYLCTADGPANAPFDFENTAIESDTRLIALWTDPVTVLGDLSYVSVTANGEPLSFAEGKALVPAGTTLVFTPDAGWAMSGFEPEIEGGDKGFATVILAADDVWEDGTGYQMLIDADATACGDIIPSEGLYRLYDVSDEMYGQFEYRIPENADCGLLTKNIVLNSMDRIKIPAGTYDWCIVNPTPEDEIVWIASDSEDGIDGRCDDYEFEGGKTYMFKVGRTASGDNDIVRLQIKDNLTYEASGSGFSMVMPEGGVTVFYTVKDGPTFEKQSLTLDGTIGVNFFMDLPAIEGIDYTDSEMVFTVSNKGGGEQRVKFNPSRKNSDGTLYGFTCRVTSIQMADNITAEFHYTQDGEEMTVVKEAYSVKQYVEAFVGTGVTGAMLDLVHALADYGHYVQPFLSRERGWKIPDDHDEMDTSYAEGFVYTDITGVLSDKKIVTENNTNDKIEKITYSLTLDSDTAINVYFKMSDESDLALYFCSASSDEYTFTKCKDGRYCLTISGIGAHELGKTYNIIVNIDGNEDAYASVSVSAMSYVLSALIYYTKYPDKDEYEAGRKAVSSLYAYWKAADNYLGSLNNG